MTKAAPMHETLEYRDLSDRAARTAAHECGQALFNGCPGNPCDRNCSARMYIPPPLVERSHWTAVLYAAGFAVISITIIGAAFVGLSRVERAYQIERV